MRERGLLRLTEGGRGRFSWTRYDLISQWPLLPASSLCGGWIDPRLRGCLHPPLGDTSEALASDTSSLHWMLLYREGRRSQAAERAATGRASSWRGMEDEGEKTRGDEGVMKRERV